MPRVLADEYHALGPIDATQNVASRDILVWWLGGSDAYHSAVVEEPHLKNDGTLDPATTVISSKTGTGPLWKGIMTDDVKRQYRQASYIEVYRRL